MVAYVSMSKTPILKQDFLERRIWRENMLPIGNKNMVMEIV